MIDNLDSKVLICMEKCRNRRHSSLLEEFLSKVGENVCVLSKTKWESSSLPASFWNCFYLFICHSFAITAVQLQIHWKSSSNSGHIVWSQCASLEGSFIEFILCSWAIGYKIAISCTQSVYFSVKEMPHL